MHLPEPVLRLAESLKDLLLFLMRNYLVPAVDCAFAVLEEGWHLWLASCKWVPFPLLFPLGPPLVG